MNVDLFKTPLTSILLLNKSDIMETLELIKEYCIKQEIIISEDINSEFKQEFINQLEILIRKTKESNFPDLLSLPWCYYVNLTLKNFEIGLGRVNIYESDEPSRFFVVDDISSKLAIKRVKGRRYVGMIVPEYTLVNHQIPQMTAEEYGAKMKLSPISVRQYIREGLIAGAEKIGGQWFVSALAKKRNNDESYAVIYQVVDKVLDVPLKFKYLDDPTIKSIVLIRSKKDGLIVKKSRNFVMLNMRDKHEAIELSLKEFKEVETFIQSSISYKAEYDMDFNLLVWDKLRVKIEQDIKDSGPISNLAITGLIMLAE